MPFLPSPSYGPSLLLANSPLTAPLSPILEQYINQTIGGMSGAENCQNKIIDLIKLFF
jgi:hypothetical protein